MGACLDRIMIRVVPNPRPLWRKGQVWYNPEYKRDVRQRYKVGEQHIKVETFQPETAEELFQRLFEQDHYHWKTHQNESERQCFSCHGATICWWDRSLQSEYFDVALSGISDHLGIKLGHLGPDIVLSDLSVEPVREIVVLYNEHDKDVVAKLSVTLSRGCSYVINARSTDTLESWQRLHSRLKVVVILSDSYLQAIGQSSEYKSINTRSTIRSIHRRPETLIIQLGEITSEILDGIYGQTWPNINWFRWPEREDERVGFWNTFTCHIEK